jgi:hypothetical protein
MNFQLRIAILMWRFNRDHFFRELGDSFERKVPLRDHLDTAIRNATTMGDSQSRSVLKYALKRLGDGHSASLSGLFYGIVPASDQLLLATVDDATAESQGLALKAAADAVAFKQSALTTMLQNMVIPLVALVAVGAISVIIAEPIASIAQNNDNPEIWTGFNGTVRWLANFILENWGVILAAVLGTIALAFWKIPTWTGIARLKFDKLPIVGMYREYQGAIVLSALAMMLGSGKNMLEAVEALRTRGSPWLRWQMGRIKQSLIDQPTEYLAAMSRGLFTPTVQARMASLMDSGGIDKALVTLGQREVATLEKNLRTTAQWTGQALTFSFVGVVVYLSIGLMTISGSLDKANDPNKSVKPAAHSQ